MCSPAPCRGCGKVTWSGCGAHVDQVMARVPTEQRCTCDGNAAAAATPSSGGLLGRLLGRSG